MHATNMGATPKPGKRPGGEATPKVCGVGDGDAAGVQLDGSLVDRVVVNVGSGLVPPYPPSGGGQARRRLMVPTVAESS